MVFLYLASISGLLVLTSHDILLTHRLVSLRLFDALLLPLSPLKLVCCLCAHSTSGVNFPYQIQFDRAISKLRSIRKSANQMRKMFYPSQSTFMPFNRSPSSLRVYCNWKYRSHVFSDLTYHREFLVSLQVSTHGIGVQACE